MLCCVEGFQCRFVKHNSCSAIPFFSSICTSSVQPAFLQTIVLSVLNLAGLAKFSSVVSVVGIQFPCWLMEYDFGGVVVTFEMYF